MKAERTTRASLKTGKLSVPTEVALGDFVAFLAGLPTCFLTPVGLLPFGDVGVWRVEEPCLVLALVVEGGGVGGAAALRDDGVVVGLDVEGGGETCRLA